MSILPAPVLFRNQLNLAGVSFVHRYEFDCLEPCREECYVSGESTVEFEAPVRAVGVRVQSGSVSCKIQDSDGETIQARVVTPGQDFSICDPQQLLDITFVTMTENEPTKGGTKVTVCSGS